jgi:hypothetical protein
VLVAGDAFTTVRGESAVATYTQKQEVHGPPAYFTPDWDAARVSVAELLSLVPEVGATGHGIAMHGEALRSELAHLAVHFNTLARPKIGRYAHHPATADERGVRSVPPPLVSPWIKSLAIAGALLGVGALLINSQKGHKKGKKGKTHRAWYRDRPARPRPYKK